MRAFWRMAFLEATSSRLLVAGLPVVGIGLIFAFNQVWPGLFLWQNRSSAVISSLTIVDPLVAALAAWDGLRIRTAGRRWMWRQSHDGGRRAIGTLLVAQAGLTVGIFVAVALGTHLPVGVPGVPPGGPVWIWLVSGAVSTLVAAGLGLVLGLAVPFFPTVVVVPGVVYGAGAIVFLQGAQVSSSRAALSPTYQQVLEPFYVVDSTFFALQGLWFGALLLVTTALCFAAVLRRTPVPAACTAAALVVASVTGLTVGGGHDQPSILVQAQPFRCAGSSPKLCVTADFEPARASIRDALEPAFARLRVTPLAFDRVELRPRGVLGEATLGAVALHLDDESAGWQDRVVVELVQEMLDPANPRGVCTGVSVTHPQSLSVDAGAVVLAWASGDSSLLAGDDGLSAALTRFATLSPSDRGSFLAEHLDGLCSGSLALAALP